MRKLVIAVILVAVLEIMLAGCMGGDRKLLVAADKGDLKGVISALMAGANVEARGHYEATPLINAAMHNHTQVAKLLIDLGADVNARDEDGSTPLIWAGFKGNIKIAKLLLDHGADVNARDYTMNRTALAEAFAYGYSDVVEFLRQHGGVE